MAGGDLDGDVYHMFWDEDLMAALAKARIHEPQPYEKPSTEEVNRETFKSERLEDMFCYYLEHDYLGKVANLHINLCDFLGPQGPMDARCLRLSMLQAVAVDFAKHGKCIQKSDFSDIEETIKTKPDFLEPVHGRLRESEGILGELFRMVDP